MACAAINKTSYYSVAPWTRQSAAFVASASPLTSRHRRECAADVSRLIPIWPKLGTRPLVEKEAGRWAVARRSRLPAPTYADFGTRFDLGGGRTGPDMAVGDAWELQRQMVSPGQAAANRAVKAWLQKFQERHGLPVVPKRLQVKQLATVIGRGSPSNNAGVDRWRRCMRWGALTGCSLIASVGSGTDRPATCRSTICVHAAHRR